MIRDREGKRLSPAPLPFHRGSFQYRDDAVRFHQALRERLEKFSLQLHGEKTRLIEFGRFAQEKRERRGEGKARIFDFPGFTHICARTRNDMFRVLRQSVAERQRAKVRTIAQELRKRRELPIAVQGAWLQSVLRGRYGYHAVPGNLRAWKLPAGSDQTLVTQSLPPKPQKAAHVEQNESPRPPVAAGAQSPAFLSCGTFFRRQNSR